MRLGRFVELGLQRGEFLGLFGCQVVGLGEIFFQVVEFPAVLVLVSRREVLTPGARVLGIGLPAVFVHGTICKYLEILFVTPLEIWVVEAGKK